MDPLLAGIVPTAVLEPHLTAARQRLAADHGVPAGAVALRMHDEVWQDLLDPQRRAAARDTLFARWAREPDSVLWPELVARQAHLVGNRERVAACFATLAAQDTTSAIGAYLLGWRRPAVGNMITSFGQAHERVGDLPPFPAAWVTLRAAYALRLDGRPREARDLVLALLPRAAAAGGAAFESRVWAEIGRDSEALGERGDALLAAVTADSFAAMAWSGEGPIVTRLISRGFMARVLAARRDSAAAYVLYEQNFNQAKQANLPDMVAINLDYAGLLAGSLGDHRRRVDYGERALFHARASGDSLGMPRYMMNVARHLRMLGDLDSCLVYQQQAERVIAAYPIPANLARMPLMQAEYYAQIGRYDVVDSLLQAAVALTPAKTTVDVRAELHLELIRGWMEAGRPDLVYRSLEAIADLRHGYGDAMADRHVSADLNLLLAEFFTRRHEYGRATEALDLAADQLAQRPDPRRAWALARNRGDLARARGSLDRAVDEFRTCLDLARELGTPQEVAAARLRLGSTLIDRGNFIEARTVSIEAGHSAAPGLPVLSIAADMLVAESHVREGHPAEALAVLERARGTSRPWHPPDVLARLDLQEGRALAAAGRSQEARACFEAVASRLASPGWLEQTPELASFDGDLRRDVVEAFCALPTVGAADGLLFARRALPAWQGGSGAVGRLATPQLIFFLGREASFRWFVTQAGVTWRQLPGEAALRDQLDPVLADLGAPGRPVPATEAAALGRALVGGLLNAWAPETPLVIVPDLALFAVPWAALPLDGAGGLLLDRGPVVVCGAPLAAGGAPRSRDEARPLLVVGADAAGGADRLGLSRLRHAEGEARDVAAAQGESPVTLLLGEAAAMAFADGATLFSYGAIHVASHATVYSDDASRTMLLLAGADDKPLTARDIKRLRLEADLVFLSCCEAGDGRDARAAHAGLAQAYLDAGARAVVAPLAAIDDAAARELAVRFHAHWRGSVTVAEALRQAQRELREAGGRFAHPYYWSFYQVSY